MLLSGIIKGRVPEVFATVVFALSTLVCGAQDGVPGHFALLAEHLSRGEKDLMPTPGNSVEIMTSGEHMWELMVEDIRNAKESIWLEYYRWKDDKAGRQIRDAIMEKIREGLDVRLLIEDIANPLYRKDFYLQMRDAGAKLVFFTDTDKPLWKILKHIGVRDHRKIVVIDGKTGFCGGMNLAVEYRSLWRDTHMRIEGPAVQQLEKLFMDMWIARGGDRPAEANGSRQTPVSAAGDGSQPVADGVTVQFATAGGGDTLLEDAVCELLLSAKEYVYIQTPYFCPPDHVLEALAEAVARGIKVFILVPDETDIGFATLANQSYFEECLLSGVKIFEYTERMNHSKVILSDDCLTIVGTLNMDNRSLHINHEVVAAIYDTAVAKSCRQEFDRLFSEAHEVTLDDIRAWTPQDRNARLFWRHHSSLL